MGHNCPDCGAVLPRVRPCSCGFATRQTARLNGPRFTLAVLAAEGCYACWMVPHLPAWAHWLATYVAVFYMILALVTVVLALEVSEVATRSAPGYVDKARADMRARALYGCSYAELCQQSAERKALVKRARRHVRDKQVLALIAARRVQNVEGVGSGRIRTET